MRYTIGLLLLLLLPQLAEARPPKRFHEGPYLQLLLGGMEVGHDTNVRTNQRIGSDTEPAFGFYFGWNLSDPIAVQLVGRYATAETLGAREHLVRLNIDWRWHWIADWFTDLRGMAFLPFVQAGPLVEVSVLPDDPAVGTATASQWGGGISIGGGFNILAAEYLYLSVTGQGDFVRRKAISQSVGGVPTAIYAGGWGAGWSVTTGVGIHF